MIRFGTDHCNATRSAGVGVSRTIPLFAVIRLYIRQKRLRRLYGVRSSVGEVVEMHSLRRVVATLILLAAAVAGPYRAAAQAQAPSESDGGAAESTATPPTP